MTEAISKAEMIWNETQMFSRELINPQFLDVNYRDLPEDVRQQFDALIGGDVPRETFV